MKQTYIHPSAHIDPSSSIGKECTIWINVQIREGVIIGDRCVVGKDVYIDKNVTIGAGCKIQNSALIYLGVTIKDHVFIGPNVTFTNDKVPRAFNADWQVAPTLVEEGASIGANATIVCGTTLGEYCMVGAGAVVTKDVTPYTLVKGNPARPYARIDRMGNVVEIISC